MKKYVFIILLLILFLGPKNIYAFDKKPFSYSEDSIDVCNSGCEFSSIDQVLSAAENDQYVGSAPVSINVSTWNEQTLSDHDLHFPVEINFSNSAAVINGNGATIKADYGFYFTGRNLDIKNINFIFNNTNNDYNDELFLIFETKNVNIDNLKVSSNKKMVCNRDNYNMGIFSYGGNMVIKNSTVSGFTIGVASESGNLNVDGCDLKDNYFSINAAFTKGAVSNSKLSKLLTFGNFTIKESNDFGDLKVKLLDPETLEGQSDICEMFSKNYIYVVNINNASVEMRKSIDIDLGESKEIKNILSFFRDGEVNVEGFTFEVSNPDIAKVENGNVILLRQGTTEITASNETTAEKYTLIVNATTPSIIDNVVDNITNPATGTNTISLIILIIALTSIGGVLTYKLKKN